MKDRPILFSAPMVRALLDGSKTHTRRVVKPQPRTRADIGHHGSGMPFIRAEFRPAPCPYGKPGDRLWVREAWRTVAAANNIPPRDLINAESFTHYEADEGNSSGMGKLRPGMFMPRWASRITLEIVSVRVDRLQDISEADARAEGITDGGCLSCGEHEPCGCTNPTPDARDSYIRLWESINGADSWAANPWVWVVEFRRID